MKKVANLMKCNIVLTGFMGSGKTTTGKILTEKTGLPFIDTDFRIEEDSGKKISTIFAQEGEAAFRGMETTILKELLKSPDKKIISTGGGLPVRSENRKLLSRIGTVVYLYASPEAIYERLKEDKTRPLLQGEDPMDKIQKLWEQRESLYRSCAGIIIETMDKDKTEIADEIIEQIIQLKADR